MIKILKDYFFLCSNRKNVEFFKQLRSKRFDTYYAEVYDDVSNSSLEKIVQDLANLTDKESLLYVRYKGCDEIIKRKILNSVSSDYLISKISRLDDKINIEMENSVNYIGAGGTGKRYMKLKKELSEFDINVIEKNKVGFTAKPDDSKLSKEVLVILNKDKLKKELPKVFKNSRIEHIKNTYHIYYTNSNIDSRLVDRWKTQLTKFISNPIKLINADPSGTFIKQKIKSTIPKGVYIKDLHYYSEAHYASLQIRLKEEDKEKVRLWRKKLKKDLDIEIWFKTDWLSDKLVHLANDNGILQDTKGFDNYLKQIVIKKNGHFSSINFNTKLFRNDLTHLNCFSIDPPGAKDLDDAISVEIDSGKTRLGVHISDVSALVGHNTKLDKHARKKVETIYGAREIITMLPKDFSFLTASLNKGEKKEVFSVFFEFDSNFKLLDRYVKRSLIQSRYALSYEDADQIINGKRHEFGLELKHLDLIASNIKNYRSEHYEIIFEKKSKTKNMIMECMLLANKSVAEFLSQSEISFPYRVHQSPDESMQKKLSLKFKAMGYDDINTDNIKDKKYLRHLLKVLQNKDPLIVSVIMDEYLGKAFYSLDNLGHFALGFDNYCHFTSPIRRYMDIIVHRQLSSLLYEEEPIKRDELEDIILSVNRDSKRIMKLENELHFYESVKDYLSRIGSKMDAKIVGIKKDHIRVFCSDLDTNGVVYISKNKKIVEQLNSIFLYDMTSRTKQYVGDDLNLKLIGFSIKDELPCFYI